MIGSSSSVIWLTLLLGMLSAPLKAESKLIEYKSPAPMQLLLQTSSSSLSINDEHLTTQAIRPAFSYFLTNRVAIEVGYLVMMYLQDGTSLLYGFDTAAKWHLFSSGTPERITIDGVSMHKKPNFTHYLLTAYRWRTLNLPTGQIGYSGYGIGYGANWYLNGFNNSILGDGLFINGELSSDTLTVAIGDKLSITNISLGIGWNF